MHGFELIFTAYDWREIEKEAEKLGVDHFMPKPFFITTLREVIWWAVVNQKKERKPTVWW